MTGLGDAVSRALAVVGLTDERVSRWLGRPCGCARRRRKLDALTWWALRVLSGRRERAAEHLDELTEEE